MRRSVATISLLVLICAGPAGAAELQSTVPARFQGDWASSVKQCGADYDELRLSIGASTIRFQESGGSIKAVVTQGESELALISELSGEGETWLDISHFRLSTDQSTLVDMTGETEVVRHRCPKKA